MGGTRMPMARPDAITLDVGGTLIQPWPSVGHVYQQAAESFGLGSFDAKALETGFLEGWRQRQGFDYSRAAWKGLVDAAFARVHPEPVSQEFFDHLYDRFGEPGCWRVYPEVRPVLDRLHQAGIRLAIVSNWDERLRPLLSALGLLDPMSAVLISGEVGCGKPDPAIFRQAASEMGISLARILHVGDSRKEDFDGAQRVGCQAVWLRRDRPAGELSWPEISDLDALTRLLEKNT